MVAYNKERKVCVDVLSKSKNSCYENLDNKNITNNKSMGYCETTFKHLNYIK